MQIRPCFIHQIAREWADKLIAGRVAFSSDYLHADAGELVDEYVDRQAALIESQAAIAAEVWAKRNGLEPAEQPASLQAEMAAAIAEVVAAAAAAQYSADDQVAARLQYVPDSDPEKAA
jgi:hypothetical protein